MIIILILVNIYIDINLKFSLRYHLISIIVSKTKMVNNQCELPTSTTWFKECNSVRFPAKDGQLMEKDEQKKEAICKMCKKYHKNNEFYLSPSK